MSLSLQARDYVAALSRAIARNHEIPSVFRNPGRVRRPWRVVTCHVKPTDRVACYSPLLFTSQFGVGVESIIMHRMSNQRFKNVR